ncbi:hypothetical protein, partial [Fibrobacter sp. UWEL]|uniref:hypothetical protein n=1 Tax=Fibrobacter sp. UWEL TaxID=1896209 RepID=UPI000923DFBB
MNELDELQQEINHLAYSTFTRTCSLLGKDLLEKFSIPLIPRITQEYFNHRLVILGQETSTWYGRAWYDSCGNNNPLYKHFNLYEFINAQEDEVRNICQICRYDDFTLYGGAQNRKGFWEFNRKICREVLEDPIEANKPLPFCWLDLFCVETVEYDGKKPSQDKNLANTVVSMQENLLYEILKLIRPKIILAETHHKNDMFLKDYALGDPNALDIPPFLRSKCPLSISKNGAERGLSCPEKLPIQPS